MVGVGLCFVIFMTIGPRRSVVGTIGKGIFGSVLLLLVDGEEHRQYLCHEGDKQGVHAQEEGTQVNHRVQFMKGESWQLSAFCSLSSWSLISGPRPVSAWGCSLLRVRSC